VRTGLDRPPPLLEELAADLLGPRQHRVERVVVLAPIELVVHQEHERADRRARDDRGSGFVAAALQPPEHCRFREALHLSFPHRLLPANNLVVRQTIPYTAPAEVRPQPDETSPAGQTASLPAECRRGSHPGW